MILFDLIGKIILGALALAVFALCALGVYIGGIVALAVWHEYQRRRHE